MTDNEPTDYWSFRVMRHVGGQDTPLHDGESADDPEVQQREWYAVHEVHFDRDRNLASWEQTPAQAYGVDGADLEWTISAIAAAMSQPVFDFQTGEELGVLLMPESAFAETADEDAAMPPVELNRFDGVPDLEAERRLKERGIENPYNTLEGSLRELRQRNERD
jgi:hypothetical protein